MTTPLAERLRARIAVEGPLTVAAFMLEVLAHPEHGYYMRQDPFGCAGDFTTAPEISQMFGELIGVWCVQAWRDMGEPNPISVIELGPGRGTLLADAWRAFKLVPEFCAAVRIHLVEISPVLRDVQGRTMRARGLPGPEWHDTLATVPEDPCILLANELFDALPIHQFVKTEAGWRERLVAVAETGFRFVLDKHWSPRAVLIPDTVREAPPGSVAEISPAAISLAAEIGRRVAASGGAALLIDYGHPRSSSGDTLQAMRRHRPCEPLSEPGDADLTAHVDFERIARAAAEAGAEVYGPVPQSDFLRRMGIETRAEILLARASAPQARDIVAGCRRLIAPEGMGTLFQVLAVAAAGRPPPIGFDPVAEPEV